ncbi:hypothetical protein [Butyricimonas paravirosa]|uniref:hypothetical protein n=1 Tax=Butyricimonas paravirosa TaxID=1472417 RepID=UPI002109CED4|nr:hypothetical protein [Butyricimonas paravirosa]MCQ4874663.1 hypothetical protein [Butyricimonas paravirosa]
MKRLLYNLMGLILVATMYISCAEDDLTPNELAPDYFLEPYGASEADALLQKEFYAREKVYLLFNDTLRREYLGDDSEGNAVYSYQVVDMTYGLTSSSSIMNIFEYQYMKSDAEKRTAVEFISEMILPSLGGDLRPYSVLLVDRIDQYVYNYVDYVLSNPNVYAGWRCTAIAVKGVDNMTEEEQRAYKSSLLKSMVANKVATLDQSIFDEFYSFCAQYYSTYILGEGPVKEFIAQYPTEKDLGLLSTYGYGFNGYSYIVNFKAKNYDLDDYTNALFDRSEEDFMNENADYPIVIKKYRILKKIIEDLGVIFN